MIETPIEIRTHEVQTAIGVFFYPLQIKVFSDLSFRFYIDAKTKKVQNRNRKKEKNSFFVYQRSSYKVVCLYITIYMADKEIAR